MMIVLAVGGGKNSLTKGRRVDLLLSAAIMCVLLFVAYWINADGEDGFDIVLRRHNIMGGTSDSPQTCSECDDCWLRTNRSAIVNRASLVSIHPSEGNGRH